MKVFVKASLAASAEDNIGKNGKFFFQRIFSPAEFSQIRTYLFRLILRSDI
jgi:hypothetical protein